MSSNEHKEHRPIEFLQMFAPSGPWVLTAIDPSRTGMTTQTFFPSNTAECRDWIAEYEGVRNLYFMVNTPTKALRKKASREDVKQLDWLHVDCDPRAGEDFERERQRILARLQSYPKRPTCIIDSGGGYQAFWKLQTPLLIGGDVRVAEDAKYWNIGLELALGGDNCHNVDRIMRLPFTTNIPDERKRRRGRKQRMAVVVEFAEERQYQIDEFEKAAAPTPRNHGILDFKTEQVHRLKSVDDLPEVVPDWCRQLIVQGPTPDNSHQYPSRSEAVFAVACELVRAGCGDEVIFSVLTDSRFAISESILERGPGAERYARRQVQRAKDHAIHPMLAQLNNDHAVVQIGGRTRVLSWEKTDHEDGRTVPVYQSFEDFRNRYLNRFVTTGERTNGNEVRVRAGKWWLENPHRREYAGIRFLPGGPGVVDGYLNLWEGFSVEPRSGPWPLMQRHILEVLAAGEEQSADYIKKWVAWAIQHPDRPAEVALVFKGPKGAGKGQFGRALKRLFGRHGLHISSPQQLTGRFNAHLQDTCLLFADEAVAANDKVAESALKALITEPEIVIEAKGVNAVQMPNRLHVVMASNEQWVVPAGADERRFAVFEVSKGRVNDFDYFAALAGEMDGEGLAAMLHELNALDLGRWHPREGIPQTLALRRQKDLSLSGEEQFMLEILEEGVLPGTGPTDDPYGRYSSGDAASPGIFDLMRSASPSLRGVSYQRLATVLRAWGCTRITDGKRRGWRFPPLCKMRERWDGVHGDRRWAPQQDWAHMEVVPSKRGPF